jgi:hypothetical protein
MKRKSSEEGLMQRYNTDSNFALSYRIISAMPFIPIKKLKEALEVLKVYVARRVESGC